MNYTMIWAQIEHMHKLESNHLSDEIFPTLLVAKPWKGLSDEKINELLENNSIEICIYKYFLKNINIVEKINVDGYLSTEGYYCSF